MNLDKKTKNKHKKFNHFKTYCKSLFHRSIFIKEKQTWENEHHVHHQNAE